jgi:PKD repeat protein
LKGILVAAIVAWALPALGDSCVWYSHADSIRQVRTSTNQVTRIIALRHPQRLVMNAEDCGVWTLDKRDRRLLRFDAEGNLEREIRVRSLDRRLDEVERLQLDPYDGSLWVSDERRLFHVSPEGTLLGGFSAPGSIRRLRVALDQTLWVLGKRDLWQFDPAGNLLATFVLGRHLAADARHFAIDELGGFIWLADEHELARLSLANPAQPPLRLRLRHRIAGFALDPYTGNAWLAQKKALLAFSRAGALAHSVDLEALKIRQPERLGFEPVSRSLWMTSRGALTRFTQSGELTASIALRARDDEEDGDDDDDNEAPSPRALGVPAFKVQPTLSLIRPPQDALANNPAPEFRLGYGAECNGTACAFPSSYFGGYRLSATLNNQPIGSAFQFDANTGESSFTPSSRLPEGPHRFSAQVKDAFGHSSNTVTNTFTVDTIAPRFLAISPADGSLFQGPQVLIRGTIDDPQATVILEGLGLTQTGASFGFPVTLQPGPNVFVLSAIDRAGNRASARRTLNFVPLTLSIRSPANGALVSGSSVAVTGTLQGPPNTGVTVNGVVAAIVGNEFFAQVPLAAGANAITVVAATPDGFRVERSVSVVNSGPPAIEIVADRTSGLPPLKVVFRASAPVTVQRIEADFDGNGTADATFANANTVMEFTYVQAGLYAARFTIVDGQGVSTTQIVQVLVQDRLVIDAMLKAAWQGFVTTMAAGNVSAAGSYMSDSAKEKYLPMLEALRDRLPAIAASFSEPRTFSLSSGLGEYAIRRAESNGKTYMYLIYFGQGQDGVWRLESM